MSLIDASALQQIALHLLDSAPNLCLVLDEHGMIVYANRQSGQLLAPPVGVLSGRRIWEIDLYLSAEKWSAQRESLATHQSLRRESAFSAAGGQLFPVLVSTTVIAQAGTNYYLLQAEPIQVTEVDPEQTAVDAHEHALLRGLLDATSDLIFYKDTAGTYLGSNRAFEDFVGRAGQHIVGRADLDIFPAPMAERMIAEDQDVVDSARPRRHEAWVQYPDGSSRLLDVLKTPFFGADGQVLGLIGIGRDMTERQQTQAALQDSEQRFRQLIEGLKVGVLLLTPGGDILIANQSALDLLALPENIPASEAPSLLSEAWVFSHENGSPWPIRETPMAQAVENGSPVRRQIIGIRPSTENEPRWLLMDVEPQLDDEGVVAQLICTIGDLTHQRSMQQTLARRQQALSSLAEIAVELLQKGSDALPWAMAQLGTANQISRITVFENVLAEDETLFMHRTHQWLAEDVTDEIRNADESNWVDRPYVPEFARWLAILSRGDIIRSLVADLPEAEQNVLAARGAQAILVIPLLNDDGLYGFIGLEDCRQERQWTDGEVEVLQTIASIVVSTLVQARLLADNAAAVARAEAAAAEAQSAYQRYIQQSWDRFLTDHPVTGIQTMVQAETAAELASQVELLQQDVISRGETRTFNWETRLADETAPETTAPASALVAPLLLRGQAIGTLSLADLAPERDWSADEVALVETISEQLALTVENLRLFDTTQQRAAREQITRQLTDRIRRAATTQEILQTTVNELLAALGVTEAFIDLDTATSLPYTEAPALLREVLAGKMPPVEERLPQEPLLLQPVERVGRYGGTWRLRFSSRRDHGFLIRTMGYENLMRWSPNGTGVLPNIALAVEASPDNTTFIFTLRPGMRWSDGAPFTVDDILFWYEDVFSNPALTSLPPAWLTSGGTPVTVSQVDDWRVAFTFATPNSLFLQRLAEPAGAEPTSYPRHYLSQFHERHNTETLDSLVAITRSEDWVALFQAKAGQPGNIDHPSRWANPELPTLNAWCLQQGYHEDVERIEALRNPYYWKIDPEGQQLPYIDRLVFDAPLDHETFILSVTRGDIDMQMRGLPNTLAVRERLQAHANQGRYRFFQAVPALSNTLALSLNLTHSDPAKRNLFRNRSFRVALSVAINRPRIIETVFGGLGEPYQVAPRPESPFYLEKLARQYTDYDPSQANHMLDALNFSQRDEAGYRLNLEGQRLSLTVDVIEGQLTRIQTVELIREDWRAVGVELLILVKSRAEMYRDKAENRFDAIAWQGDGGLNPQLDPRYYVPVSEESNYALGWAAWYRDRSDPQAEQPPLTVQQQMSTYNDLTQAASDEEQTRLMWEILQQASEHFYVIGVSLPPPGFGVVKHNFHNVPRSMLFDWSYPNPAPTNPAQYFIEAGDTSGGDNV